MTQNRHCISPQSCSATLFIAMQNQILCPTNKMDFWPSVNPGPPPIHHFSHRFPHSQSPIHSPPLPNILSRPLCLSTYCCGHVQLFSAFHAFYIFVTADCPSLSFSVLYQRLTLSWSVRQRCRDVKRNMTHHKPRIAKIVWKWETFAVDRFQCSFNQTENLPLDWS